MYVSVLGRKWIEASEKRLLVCKLNGEKRSFPVAMSVNLNACVLDLKKKNS